MDKETYKERARLIRVGKKAEVYIEEVFKEIEGMDGRTKTARSMKRLLAGLIREYGQIKRELFPEKFVTLNKQARRFLSE